MKKLSILLYGLFISYIFLLQPFFSWAQRIEITIEDGITVIRNPKTPVPPPGVSSTVILKEDLIVGTETAKEDYWFSMLNSIAVDDSGNIYTLDPKDIKIRVFNPNGKLLRTFGRKGQGPAEFQGPGSMKIMPDGNLAVYDVLARRFLFLTPEGELLKTVSTSRLPMGSVRIDSRGFVYQHKMIRRPKVVDELVKYDPSLNPVMVIHSFEEVWKPREMNPYSKRYLFDMTRNDNLIWLVSSAYDMHVVNPDGKTIRRIIKDHDPVEMTDAHKEQYMKEQSSRGAPLPIKFVFPDFYPASAGLHIDDQDRIYVRTYQKNGQGRVYHDVFDPEGRYIANFLLPEKEQAAVVKDNKLYCILPEGEKGFPLVKRYTLVWK